MTLSMFQVSLPAFTLGLANLLTLLEKGAAYAEAKKIDPLVLTSSRLFPDMFPLSRQVQIACDVVKGGAARLAGVEVPSFPDTETTFPELQDRVRKTIAFIQTLTAQQIDGSESRTINLKVGGKEMTFSGSDYLLKFVLPNLHFHTSVTYSLLRHNGVELGKADFLGAIQ